MTTTPIDTGRAPRNRTLSLSTEEARRYRSQLITVSHPVTVPEIRNRTIHQDSLQAVDHLPDAFVDLLFIDPPYNLDKQFNTTVFRRRSSGGYQDWFESWFPNFLRVLKPTASVYICGDWRSSTAIFNVIDNHLKVRNRITWEREKGRGARSNWKNCSEDLWFCTVSDDYFFDAEAVKLRRRVIAPYTDGDGKPKDWDRSHDGDFRTTYASNLWSDLTVPFWSMPENTDHPTQKPEKLLAKVILASSRPGEMVLDPFLGSGTTSVVARKLGRGYAGIEIDETFCCYAEKRLALAEQNKAIQGYTDGIFWERNSGPIQKSQSNGRVRCASGSLFEEGEE